MGHGGEFGLGYGGPEEWNDGWVFKERNVESLRSER